jgi:arylsulfatase A-like enzyme
MRNSQRELSLSRRDLFRLGITGGVLTAMNAGGSAAPLEPTRPNILFIMSDQHRGDCLGVAGNESARTPNLDRLAREGAWFEHAYSTTPTCTPARAALLTGLGPWRHGMLGYGRVGEGYAIEMPQALRDAGYYTCGIGTMHWHPQRHLHGFHKTILDESGRELTIDFRSDYRAWLATVDPNADPDATGLTFNDYRARPYKLPEEYHPTRWTGDVAVNFIKSYRREQPFFLKVSFARPHSPYDPPQRVWDDFADADLPPARVGDWAARYATPSPNEPDIWHGDKGAEQVRTSRRGYYASVAFVDEQIGRIIAALEQRNLLENTLILYTSDHGDMTGDHHLWRKSYAYEASARIPMIVRWPLGTLSNAPGPTRGGLPQPVEIRDILPTFLDAAGAKGAESLDGRSMLEPITRKRAKWRDAIDLEHDVCYDPSNHWSAMTDGRYKFIFHAQTGEEQFFDLREDPYELRDLSRDGGYRRRVGEWRDRLIEHLAERGEPFVVKGKLGVRPESYLYSPNWPGCKCHGTARRAG